jgi:hypothetical protein
MISCNNAYYTVGIIRNMVDLMADFCVKGIDWAHTNRNIEAFYREWFNQVHGYDVSERFCNYLSRLGNNCVFTNYMRVPDNVATEWKKTRGEDFKNVVASSRKIPGQYIFIDITALSELYPDLGKFTTKRTFVLSFAGGLVNSMSYGPNSANRINSQFDIANVIKYIPDELRKKITENNGNMVFNSDELRLAHYKKDDWDSWAKPLIYSILEPLNLLKKMHLADMSALDGAISNIRLWTVGYIDPTNPLNSVIPNKSMLEKVRETVLNNITAGVLDVFWGPDLTFKESNTEVHKFLGPEKYQHIMAMIYDGMGIPPSLAGGGGGGDSGFTNNFISMKVLIEKLNYLRNKLKEFWTHEAKIVQKAMGFSKPAQIRYDHMILTDETAFLSLLLQLADRNIISEEVLRDRVGETNIEKVRVQREFKERETGKLPAKITPFNNIDDDLKKIALQRGFAPSEVGLELESKKASEPGMQDVMKKTSDTNKNKGVPGQGRPKNSKDSSKRTRTPKPLGASQDLFQKMSWAHSFYQKISDVILPSVLKVFKCKNVRMMTNAQFQEFELIKFAILAHTSPHSNFDANQILEILKSSPKIPKEMQIVYNELVDGLKEPTTDILRNAQILTYATLR